MAEDGRWQVVNGKKEVDLSLTFRLSGLPSHAKLVLSRKEATSTGDQEVNVALQFSSSRLVSKFSSTTTLWQILKHWEKEKNLNLTSYGETISSAPNTKAYMQPVITYTGKEVSSNSELRSTSLAKLGLMTGNGLLRLHHKPTDMSLEDFMKVDEECAENEKVMEEREKEEVQLKREKMQKERAEMEAIEREKLILFQKEEMEKQKLAEDRRKMEQYQKSVEKEMHSKELEELRRQIQEQERKQKELERLKLEEQRREQERLEKVEQERALEELRLRESIRKKIRMEEERKKQQEEKREMELLSGPKDRKPQVFAPSSVPFDPRSIEIPDDFYEVTAQDLKNNAIIAKKKKMEQEGGNQLKTKEMREKEKIQKLSKYKSCFIRVKFPDRVEVQAVFNPLEKPSDVYQFIEECLSGSNKAVPFHLYTVPPKMIIEKSSNKNLRDLGFVPAVLMHFDINEGYSITTPYLKDEMISDIKEKLPPPQVVVPKRDQVIEATPIVNEVKIKKTHKAEEEQMEIVNSETEENKAQEKKLPAWFMKGKK